MQFYIGQIVQFALGYIPGTDDGFLPCDGRLVNISDYQQLFTLIGRTYGGDGVSTFGLPNLVGAVPIGMGASTAGTVYGLGQTGGAATVTLNGNQSPSHTHALNVVTGGAGSNTGTPGSNYVADQTTDNDESAYIQAAPTTAMASATSVAGGSQPHSNIQPVLPITFCIVTQGEFPTAE